MNDPGVDGPIEEAENQNEEAHSQWRQEEEEEAAYLDPSRWWFTSTACPLIAGTFGPVATSFNICALVSPWREYLGNPAYTLQENGLFVTDPKWLLAVNAVSLFFAVVANATLFLNMVDIMPFAWAQPLTIIGFFLASMLLIALVSVANSSLFRLQPANLYCLSQAFYYACWAAGIYCLLAILMSLTVYGVMKNKYEKDFNITKSQQTLMMQTMSFMAYLMIGAAIFGSIEGWRYNDAVYWANFTLLTIGFGTPFVPKTHAGRSLLFFYAFGGIVAVGLVINSIRQMILEKGAQKMHARTTEKLRKQIYSIGDAYFGTSKWWPKMKQRSHHLHIRKDEKNRRKAEFIAMRRLQTRAKKKNQYRGLAISVLNVALLWFLGALVFFYCETEQGLSYFECVYFAFISLVTIGYGDIQPISNPGKAFFVFWSLLAIPALTVLISDMSDTVIKAMSDLTNWLGKLAIHPFSKGFWVDLPTNINRLTKGQFFKKSGDGDQPAIDSDGEQLKNRTGDIVDLLYSRLSQEERDAVSGEGFQQHPDLSEHDKNTLFYHFLLVKEIRNLEADTHTTPPKEYTYDEWAYFLKLLGQDENNPDLHTKKYNNPRKDDERAPQVGRITDHEGNVRPWSWLSLRSPLMSSQSESQWLLSKLLEKLAGEMHFQNALVKTTGETRPAPPLEVSKVSFSEREREEVDNPGLREKMGSYV